MEHEFNTLVILAEITIAFVAFAAIVASLNVTVGNKLTPVPKAFGALFHRERNACCQRCSSSHGALGLLAG